MKMLLAALVTSGIVTSQAADPAAIPFKTMDGKESSLADYSGKVVLIVNVASKCGNTPQYAALEALYKKYGAEGFVVLGFPCNDFGGQEPGTTEEIQAFCSSKYAVTFPLFDKIHVKGAEQHPLYGALTGPEAKFPGDIQWNFEKLLVGRDGAVIARFDPRTQPDDPKVVETIEAALN